MPRTTRGGPAEAFPNDVDFEKIMRAEARRRLPGRRVALHGPRAGPGRRAVGPAGARRPL